MTKNRQLEYVAFIFNAIPFCIYHHVQFKEVKRSHCITNLVELECTACRPRSKDILREHMGTHHPSKEQASSRTNKDRKEYVKHHIPGQKGKHLGKIKDKGHRHD